jgi:hypothetical protein
MKSGDRVTTKHFNRLLTIAHANHVQVHILPRQELDWDGLYLFTPQLGAGIALREDLESSWRDWILGHELGHHFGKLPGKLFSPFHSVDSRSRQRWGEWRRLDPAEERANKWAVDTLISAEEWEAAECSSPCDLRQTVARLGLPFPAAVAWERQQRSRTDHGEPVAVPVSTEGWRTLERRLTGQGGHQAFFRRLADGRKESRMTLTFHDFSYARERVLRVKGGWLVRYRTVLDSVAPLIEKAGSVRSLFRVNALGVTAKN